MGDDGRIQGKKKVASLQAESRWADGRVWSWRKGPFPVGPRHCPLAAPCSIWAVRMLDITRGPLGTGAEKQHGAHSTSGSFLRFIF